MDRCREGVEQVLVDNGGMHGWIMKARKKQKEIEIICNNMHEWFCGWG